MLSDREERSQADYPLQLVAMGVIFVLGGLIYTGHAALYEKRFDGRGLIAVVEGALLFWLGHRGTQSGRWNQRSDAEPEWDAPASKRAGWFFVVRDDASSWTHMVAGVSIAVLAGLVALYGHFLGP